MQVLHEVYTVLWLHMHRVRRLVAGLAAYILSMTLWNVITVYMLYAAYGANEAYKLLPGVITWMFYEMALSLTAGWLNYYLFTHVIVYEVAYGHNPFLTLAGRVVVAVVTTMVASLVMYVLIPYPIGLWVLAGCILALLIGHSYGLLLAAVGAARRIPPFILDLLGYISGFAGGMAIPVRDFPSFIQPLLTLIPLAQVAEVARFETATAVLNPIHATIGALTWALTFYILAWLCSKRALYVFRKEGWKAVHL